MTMTQTTAQTELSVLISDTLTQISGDRLTQAITKAWRDPWIALPVYDTTSITYVAGTNVYTLPSTMTVLDSITYKPSSAYGPADISSDLWQVVNGQIIFNQTATTLLPSNYTLQLKGKYKLAAGDAIPDTSHGLVLQNYVIALAAWIILNQMAFSKILSFLKNDTSISEVLALKNQLQQDMLGYRSQLQTAYVDN